MVIGLPFEDRSNGPLSYDCWGLVVRSLECIDGISVFNPEQYLSGGENLSIYDDVMSKNEWVKSQNQRMGNDGDVAWYYDSGGRFSHVGRVLNGQILHAYNKNHGVCLTNKLALSQLFSRVEYMKHAMSE